jgi:copper(I)-binding protein
MGAIAVIALAVAACGGDGGVLEIDGVWARTSPRNVNAGAAYMQITSPEADRLMDVAVPSGVARRAELHETAMGEGDVMTMQQVEAIELPAGETVSLEPGGHHVMLLELAEPLEVGETFDLTLTLEGAGEITIAVEVRNEAP